MNKFNRLSVFFLASIMLFAFTYCSQDKKEVKEEKTETMKVVDVKAQDINGDGKVFVCEHCGIVADEASKCSGCGGDLHEMSLDEAQEKMGMEHKHGEHEAMHNDNHTSEMDVTMMDENHDGKVYQCPMCADQISDTLAECTKCGMALKVTSVEKAKENLEKSTKY